MAEPPSIIAALNALKNASDIIKALRSADVSFDRAQLKIQIAELAGALADARMSVLDAQEEISTLQERIRRLDARADVRSRLHYKNNAYYLAEGDKESGPYCVACFERHERLVRLTKLPSTFEGLGSFQCSSCRAVY